MPTLKSLSGVLAAVMLGAAPALGMAAASPLKTQAPGWYRMMLGDFEVTALYDGYVDLETNLIKNAKPDELKRGMARAFVPPGDKIETAVNAYLINTGTRLVLIDTGTGKVFGPTLGSLLANLRASGYDPATIDRVLITHLHGDHQGGLLDDAGKPVFTQALISPSQTESDYWLDKAEMQKTAQDGRRTFLLTQKTAAVYQATGQWRPFAPNSQILPGITAMATGHTPGHSSFVVESKGQRLIVMGDVIHFGVVQFARPDIVVEFDTDNAQAAASRKRLFAAAAKDGSLLAGAHLTFPGLGHIRSAGHGYEWVPLAYSALRTDH